MEIGTYIGWVTAGAVIVLLAEVLAGPGVGYPACSRPAVDEKLAQHRIEESLRDGPPRTFPSSLNPSRPSLLSSSS